MSVKKTKDYHTIPNKEKNCGNDWQCAKTARKIVLQLRLIQLGYFGPVEATAGLYLAKHRKHIGNYFTNSLDNNWPYSPLHDDPNDVEIKYE